MGILMSFLLSSLCVYILINVMKLLKKVWWIPNQIQSAMNSKGIKGPPYIFLYGNAKQITRMRNSVMNAPMELSHEMLPRIQPHIYAWTNLYGPNFLNWYGHQAQLVVTEPELVQEVLTNKEGAYTKRIIQNYAEKLFGDGLVASQGEKWSKMRKLAHHTFHGGSLKSMIPTIVASVETMLNRWRQNEVKEIEIFQEFKVLTSEIISRTAFGSSYLEGKNIFDMLTKMSTIVARNNFQVRIPGIKHILRSRDDTESEELEKGIRELIVMMMKTREEEVVKGKSENYGSDFLGSLMEAYHENDLSKKITLQDVIDECKTFYIAGHETTASSLTWTILLLAINPIWQHKAREEVFNLFGNHNLTSDGISRLKIMSMIVNESLRLYSPVFNITREVIKEVRLGEVVIPAKMAVCLPILAVHHNSRVWGEDVHLFKPERFADGIAKATKNSVAAFLPFGAGPRSCIGLNFATAEIKIALSMILQRYRFTLSPSYVHAPLHFLTICPKHGLQILLEPLYME